MSNKFYKCDKCGVFDVPEDAEVKVCGGEAPKDDNVVDAEFSEVDDENKA